MSLSFSGGNIPVVERYKENHLTMGFPNIVLGRTEWNFTNQWWKTLTTFGQCNTSCIVKGSSKNFTWSSKSIQASALEEWFKWRMASLKHFT